ncbi:MAG: hypothetical protein LRZ84_14430 [Desertifilum sp.]|nr:hypothetical protein [Desertifilum sp.]
MPFRQTYSRLGNDPQSRAVSSLEMVIAINGLAVGRCQGLRRSGQANPRPVTEIGSDRVVEYAPGVKMYSGSLQSIVVRYGDLIQRIASATGAAIDPDSKATTLSNFPEFDIVITSRGDGTFASPELFAQPGESKSLAGQGGMVTTLMGCCIDTFESSTSSQDVLQMESVNFRYIDEITGTQDVSVPMTKLG